MPMEVMGAIIAAPAIVRGMLTKPVMGGETLAAIPAETIVLIDCWNKTKFSKIAAKLFTSSTKFFIAYAVCVLFAIPCIVGTSLDIGNKPDGSCTASLSVSFP